MVLGLGRSSCARLAPGFLAAVHRRPPEACPGSSPSRHALLVMMAYGFLTLERLHLHQRAEQQQQQQQEVDRTATSVPARRRKRRRRNRHEPYGPRLTLPAVRRALACHLDCPYCRALAHR